MRKLSLLAVAVATVSLAVHADGIAWPSDFWDQVAAHESAVAPVPVDSSVPQDVSVFSCVGASADLCTSSAPFDSRTWVDAFVDAWLDSHACGMMLLLR